MTIFISWICIIYGTLKFSHLMGKHNPTISEVTETGVYSSSDKFNLNDEGFRFAFTIEGYADKKIKDDPAYVKYIVRVTGSKDGVGYEKLVPYHKCNESDWDNFYPTAASQE